MKKVWLDRDKFYFYWACKACGAEVPGGGTATKCACGYDFCAG